jgi:hypothetical protein
MRASVISLSRDILPGQRLNSPVLRGFIAKRPVE